jgi:hypothetical protein
VRESRNATNAQLNDTTSLQSALLPCMIIGKEQKDLDLPWLYSRLFT